MRDVFLVARFEVLRAVRTWRALALIVLFTVASAFGAYNFVQAVGFAEGQLADQLQVPRARTPGALLEQLPESDLWRDIVGNLVAPDLVDFFVTVPPLALFNLWFGFVFVPFFAASASAECIAIDVQSRAIRFEVLRTGRVEIVAGRMLGQLGLTACALFVATSAVWAVGVGFMVLSDPWGLGAWLYAYALRAACFAIPFLGLGVAASQVTSSPAWARVLGIGATAGTWILYGVARMWEADGRFLPLVDVMLQILPQGWLRGMWEPGAGWLVSSLVVAALGVTFASLGLVRFMRKDL